MTTAAMHEVNRTLPPPMVRRLDERLRDATCSQSDTDVATRDPQPKTESRHRSTCNARNSGLVRASDRGPAPLAEWAATVGHLASLAQSPVPPPSWWKAHAGFGASIETWTDPTSRGNHAPPREVFSSSMVLQLTLAGWGHLHLPGQAPRKIGPGEGFWTAMSFKGSHSLPEDSPGWTFARIEIHHPYLRSRLTQQLDTAGPLVEVRPGDALTASVVRLVRGALRYDFQDELEAELALFDFVLTFERWMRRRADGTREAQRLMDQVRSHVLARLPRAIEVSSLAAEFGMSRGHFSRVFRERTGMAPSHFATQVRIQTVEKMLLATREPLKTIANACGFANANHLCKVFRRLRAFSPDAFRRALR
jgi:AraC-like DNA-binding protein